MINHPPKWTFDAAARYALDTEGVELSVRGLTGALEEALVKAVSPSRR